MFLFSLFETDSHGGSVLNKYPQLEYYMNENKDLFNESFIKCYDAIKDRDFDEETTVKYFTTVLSNNFKKRKRKDIQFTDIHGVNEDDIYKIENHCEDRYDVSDIINESVKKQFGERKHLIWKLHFVENRTYDDLIKMGYTDVNFHNLFRQINSYIKTRLPKENEEYRLLLNKLAFM